MHLKGFKKLKEIFEFEEEEKKVYVRGDICNIEPNIIGVIIQNDMGNKHSPTVIVVPITDNKYTYVKIETTIGELHVDLSNMYTVDKSRIIKKIGSVIQKSLVYITNRLKKEIETINTSLEVFMVKIINNIGSEQGGERPMLLITTEHGAYGIPMTTQVKNNLPTHVHMNRNSTIFKNSILLFEQIKNLSEITIEKYCGKIPFSEEIKNALEISIGLKYNYN